MGLSPAGQERDEKLAQPASNKEPVTANAIARIDATPDRRDDFTKMRSPAKARAACL